MGRAVYDGFSLFSGDDASPLLRLPREHSPVLPLRLRGAGETKGVDFPVSLVRETRAIALRLIVPYGKRGGAD